MTYVEGVYSAAEDICRSAEVDLYRPDRSPTTPARGIAHRKIWKIDYEKVLKSSVVIAYVGMPSTGVGCEIEMAREAEIPVVLLCEEDRQDGVSRLVLGNPAVIDVVPFNTVEDLKGKLFPILIDIVSQINLEAAAEDGWKHSEVKELKKSKLVAARNRDKPVSVKEWQQIRADGQRQKLDLG
ncbi:MAG: hypothetical protein HY673_26255 [Chloroflexi bacterium]|nr:hypothetical protein [Chloroflexota bacterium]